MSGVITFLALCALSTASGPTPPPVGEAVPRDSLTIERRVPGLLSRRWSATDAALRLSPPLAPSAAIARSSLGLGIRPPTRPLTPLERIAFGADRGAFTGLALGTLGGWTGLWEDETAWALMGAGAALGALWGGLDDRGEHRIAVRAWRDAR